MKIGYLFFASVLSIMSAGCAVATEDAAAANPVTTSGKVKIEWQSPDKYTDIRTATEVQKRYEQRMFEELTKALDKASAKALKGKEKLELVVTDVDLAGDLRPTFGQASTSDIRIVKDIYPPRINFSYRVLDGDQVIMVGSEKLRDMRFMDRISNIDNSSFRYEKALLSDWFENTVAPKL
ncbi:DUF3016 domain-containing protein [Shewanella fodinae]|jgi:hypothetical protein|uniref:DUF3016 family protein n=1 Tax=Shewanella fodinae TaxID=552357 RepID=A0A4V2RT60_9GAMM|nr:DUF3016 domain-containing protein [Shewanella fodinae]TCN90634.1 DUF3016 family protein [Shewanella fodinae]